MANKEINYEELKQMMKQNPYSVLLDVRSKQEYEEEHLAGSISLCLYDLKENAQKIIKDKTQTIIVYCSSGSRSKEAQKELEAMGYENVYNLKGGLDSIS